MIQEKYLIELKRKWSRLCRKLHLCAADPCPWWSGSCLLQGSQSKPSIAGFLGLEGLMEHAGEIGRASCRERVCSTV